jgi:hypothetical protein
MPRRHKMCGDDTNMTTTTTTRPPTGTGTGTAATLNLILSYHASVKMMHWMTPEYAQHRALDDLHAAIGKHGDRLAETLLALAPRTTPRTTPKGSAAPRTTPKGSAAPRTFANLFTGRSTCLGALKAMHDRLVTEVRPNLPDESACSIVDDIINAFRTCMYLCAMS